jgi:hypothetical protein
MSISSPDNLSQTGLVPQTLLGYSSDAVSAIEITPTTITLGGDLTTTPVYVSINATTGLTTTNPNGLDINCDLDMNANDITNVDTISSTSNLNLNAINNIFTTSPIVVSDGTLNNTITGAGYTTRVSTLNALHYLTFVEGPATGNSPVRKTTGITCNPSTNNITATTFTGNASNATQVSLTSDNTSGSYFIPFSKTTTADNNTLFIDNTTGPLSYNPSTSTLGATIFAGSATSVALTTDNANGSFNIPFFKTNLANGNIMYIDTTGQTITYNPALGQLSTTLLAGSLSAPTSQTATTYTAGTQTLALAISNSITYVNFVFTMTGDINNLTLTGLRPNGEYYLYLTNTSGTARTVNNVLGGTANIRTSYLIPITIPATTGKGVMRILFDGTTYYVDATVYN